MLSKLFRKKRKIKRYKYSYAKSPNFANKKRSGRKTKILKRKNPKISKIKRFFSLFTITTCIVIASYSIFISSYFKVKDITFSDQSFTNQALAEEISGTIDSAMNKNIIFLETIELELKIKNLFPELESIKVNKDYPSTLIIEFFEYPLIANIINESTTIRKNYIINSIGFAIKEDLESPELPYIKIESDEPINTEVAVIEKLKLDYILESKTYFEDKFGMKIIRIEYKPTAREIHLLTERNFFIWLDIQISYEEQFKKLKKTLVKLDIYTEDLEYIDLRIAGSNGDKIIYKRN